MTVLNMIEVVPVPHTTCTCSKTTQETKSHMLSLLSSLNYCCVRTQNWGTHKHVLYVRYTQRQTLLHTCTQWKKAISSKYTLYCMPVANPFAIVTSRTGQNMSSFFYTHNQTIISSVSYYNNTYPEVCIKRLVLHVLPSQSLLAEL